MQGSFLSVFKVQVSISKKPPDYVSALEINVKIKHKTKIQNIYLHISL